MSTDTPRAQLLNELIAEIDAMTATIRQEFMPLSMEELLKEPTPEKWSILSCLAHMDITTKMYLSEFRKKLAHVNLDENAPDPDYAGGWMGDWLENMMRPKDSGKRPMPMKTMKKMEPQGHRKADEDIIASLLETLTEFRQYLEMSKKVSLKKIRVNTAVGSWFKLRLGNAYRFITAHLARHLVQAQQAHEAIRTPVQN